MKTKNKASILIVDDRPANILSLEAILASEDRTILHASSGKEALKTVLNKNIDLIILDVQMPEMDGFEVANILQSNKKTKEIPIIFASAEMTEHQSMMKGYEEGAFDYLPKPLNPEIVKAKVSILLKIHLQKKELKIKNDSLQKSALLINNSSDIIGIIDVATLKIEEINLALTTILGYSQDEVKNTSLTFYLSNQSRKLVLELSKSKNEFLSFETQVYCKDRSTRWLHWKVAVKDKKWFINARDITELKQVEKIRNYLATVVKQSQDAIYMHDHEGNIISWNKGAEKMYEYVEKEALGMKIWNIIPEYMQPEINEILNQIIQGKKVDNLETKRITKHGRLKDVIFSASIITDPEMEQRTIAITERDITGQKIADEKIKQLNADLQKNILQLESSNKELESFSYSVSHDLRAPLRALSGYASIIEEDYGKSLDKEGIGILGNIKKNADKMGQLIDDLLTFSRMGRKELSKSNVDMNQIVNEVLGEIYKNTEHHAQIKLNNLPAINGDRSLLTQVWVNLISNAIKYSSKKENPLIEIGTTSSTEEHDITYYIKDNGVGFSMEYIDKLFGVFQRLHSDKDFNGTGVGLAIVDRIIAKHGGKIWANAKVNEGCVFYFSLPGI